MLHKAHSQPLPSAPIPQPQLMDVVGEIVNVLYADHKSGWGGGRQEILKIM